MAKKTEPHQSENVVDRIMRSGGLDSVLDAHRRWLSRFDPGHLRNWEKLLAANAEAAATEAEVRHLLEDAGVTVVPGESLTGMERRPDFNCVDPQGRPFAVEVRNLGVSAVTRHTALEASSNGAGGAFAFGHMNRMIFDACIAKHGQAASVDVPVLLVVGTYHFQASALCLHPRFVEQLLTGEELITQAIDTSTGGPIGEMHLSTRLWSATFLRPRSSSRPDDEPEGPTPGRERISGLLLLGLGARPSIIRGVLHPSPLHPFDPATLPEVAFCRLRAGTRAGTLATEWIGAPIAGRR